MSGATPLDRARNFLAAYGDLYLVDHPDVVLIHSRSETDPELGEGVRFAQTFRGIPVFGAELVVRTIPGLTGGHRVVHTAGGLFVPVNPDRVPAVEQVIDTIPAITAATAENSARSALARPGAPVMGETILMLYDPGLLGFSGSPRLVWRVNLAGGSHTRLLVDAHDAGILLQYAIEPGASGLSDFDLDLEDANGGNMQDTVCFNPTTIDDEIGDEDGIDPAYLSDDDAVTAWHAARATYLAFHDQLGRHSYDNDDGELEVYVHANFGLGPPAEPNASGGAWCGVQFSNGWVSHDIMGHEFAHMVIDETSNLVGVGQPGALNESFADLMGVMVDPGDWVLGEATQASGIIRDLATPGNLACGPFPPGTPCPDRMSQFINDPGDNFGVHRNSTIISKAFYLLSVGGSQSGITVNPIGFTKAKRLTYHSSTTLPQLASFPVARNQAVATASVLKLLSIAGFNDQDICSTRNAFAAVGLGSGDGNCDGVEDNAGDLDNDGILNDGDGSDSNTDTVCPHLVTSNCDDNCQNTPNPSQADLDGDGDGDACDTDDDNDGWPDWSDPCPGLPGSPGDADGDSVTDCVDPDDDNDGILDDGDGSGNPTGYSDNECPSGVTTNCDDNCQIVANPTQFDGNSNGKGDACDPDTDGDGFYPGTDNCPFVSNPDQADTDGDSYGDACDECPNTPDGTAAYTSGIPELGFDPKPYQPDSDGDGIPDACDSLGWGDLGVALNSNLYHAQNSVPPDGSSNDMQVRGPPGGSDDARLPFPACASGSPDGLAPDQRVQIIFSGLLAGIEGWVENGDGRILARMRRSELDPSLRGMRFRPRCHEQHVLVLRTGTAFDGDESFTVMARALVPTGDNPWTSNAGLYPDPPPLPPDGDDDGISDAIDNCPTQPDPTGAESDGDGVGDVCDNCVNRSNPRVPAGWLASNPWAVLTGGQRDDDFDGYGNKCDAQFPGHTGIPNVGSQDLIQFRASLGKSRVLDICGRDGDLPCAIFDLNENSGGVPNIDSSDLNLFRVLNGRVPGPKCTACPLACAAGSAGSCF